jgi:hypothetical protein
MALEGLSVHGVGDIFASMCREWKQRGGKREHNRFHACFLVFQHENVLSQI